MENTKRVMLIKGGQTSEVVSQALKDIVSAFTAPRTASHTSTEHSLHTCVYSHIIVCCHFSYLYLCVHMCIDHLCCCTHKRHTYHYAPSKGKGHWMTRSHCEHNGILDMRQTDARTFESLSFFLLCASVSMQYVLKKPCAVMFKRFAPKTAGSYR